MLQQGGLYVCDYAEIGSGGINYGNSVERGLRSTHGLLSAQLHICPGGESRRYRHCQLDSDSNSSVILELQFIFKADPREHSLSNQ